MGNVSDLEGDYIQHTPTPLPDVTELQNAIQGGGVVHQPGTDGYTTQRNSVWNKATRGVPSAIVTPGSKEDVAAAIRYAVKYDLPLAVAGGRHSHLCMVNDSLVLDMSPFNEVIVNAESKVVEIGSGAKLGRVDAECAKFNLAVPLGHNPDTGVAGLTMGGGFGYLTRTHGLSVDNLIAVEMVLASGEIVNASATENTDLFWAIRGGGGNFGVVTKFTFQGHSIPPLIMAGNAVFLSVPIVTGILLPEPISVLKRARDYFINSPEHVCGMLILPVGGPLIAVFSHCGELEEGKLEAEKFNQIGYTPLSSISPISYHSGLQTLALGPNKDKQASGFYYEKGLIIEDLTDEFLDLVWQARSAPPPHSNVEAVFILALVGPGAVSRVGKSDTAFYNRHANWWMLLMTKYTPTVAGDQSAELACKNWAAKLHKDFSKYGISSYAAVTNDTPDLEKSHLEFVYGENLPRLLEIKKNYDPTNIFRINRNINEKLV